MQPTKWQIQLILAQKIIFCHLLKYLSKMDISAVLTLALSDYHWLRRPLHGLLHRSCIAVVYPTLELICEFWPSKFSHYSSRPVPLPEVFVTTRPDPVPKSKTTTRQSLLLVLLLGVTASASASVSAIYQSYISHMSYISHISPHHSTIDINQWQCAIVIVNRKENLYILA